MGSYREVGNVKGSSSPEEPPTFDSVRFRLGIARKPLFKIPQEAVEKWGFVAPPEEKKKLALFDPWMAPSLPEPDSKMEVGCTSTTVEPSRKKALKLEVAGIQDCTDGARPSTNRDQQESAKIGSELVKSLPIQNCSEPRPSHPGLKNEIIKDVITIKDSSESLGSVLGAKSEETMPWQDMVEAFNILKQVKKQEFKEMDAAVVSLFEVPMLSSMGLSEDVPMIYQNIYFIGRKLLSSGDVELIRYLITSAGFSSLEEMWVDDFNLPLCVRIVLAAIKSGQQGFQNFVSILREFGKSDVADLLVVKSK